MSDIYSQLKIISDSDKSFNMTKDDAAIGATAEPTDLPCLDRK